MNQLDVITGQYNRTILELQAALELNAVQERIVAKRATGLNL